MIPRLIVASEGGGGGGGAVSLHRPMRRRHPRGTALLLTLLLVVCYLPISVNAAMTYFLLRGTGSNCLSVDPLPGSTLNIRYYLPGKNVHHFECVPYCNDSVLVVGL